MPFLFIFISINLGELINVTDFLEHTADSQQILVCLVYCYMLYIYAGPVIMAHLCS